MIVNEKYRFIFIAIPKTASTTIHLAWGVAKHPPPLEYHIRLYEHISKYPHHINYFKFCFVRNPYDRFVSTWFNLTDPLAGHTWADGLLEYKSFDNFCKNFVSSKWASWVHFRPQIEYCYVDGVNLMDFIGRLENFDSDFANVCQMIDIETPRTGRYRSTPHDHFDSYYTDETKNIVYEFYKKDFEEFGYEK